ncbi:hypothetical protein DRW48_05175 [Paracoccus suum]|uniref:Uncharacterized protein n=1 Tax=Paracoccus suum TaxID=2259340 RepID=A0A344PIF0_9RHOB|nr:hypothetical protein [Paracoccus suum]AXC49155.1 hypothetical protein DRW48_05175 [Paracoccus suum]
MTDQGSPRDDQDPRPLPAQDEVIVVRDLSADTPADANDEEPDHPKIDSSLLGSGDLPAAERREMPDAERADLGAPEADRPDVTVLRDLEDLPESVEVEEAQVADTAPVFPRTDAQVSSRAEPAPVAPAPARRGGFWPLVLGGAVAAALGAGAAWWVIPNLPEGMRPGAAVPANAPGLTPEVEAAARSAATEAARAEVAAQTETLTAEARRAATEATEAALAAAPAPDVAPAPEAAALDQLTQRIATLEKAAKSPAPAPIDTKALTDRIAALEARPAAPSPQNPSTATAPATPAAAPRPDRLAELQAALADQAKRIEELAARPTVDPAEAKALAEWRNEAEATRKAIAEAAAGAETRLKDMQAEADTLAGKVADVSRKAEGAAAIAALEGALTSGGDGTSAAAQLQAAGVRPPAPLTVPLPALTDLQRDFPNAARAGLRASLKTEASQRGAGTGLANFLRAQTGARSVTPRAGTDPDAVLSRAGAAVEKGDIAAALSEIAALPEPAQAAMSSWVAPAKAWVAARRALDTLKTTP